MWAGLGYYSRAERLWKGAQKVNCQPWPTVACLTLCTGGVRNGWSHPPESRRVGKGSTRSGPVHCW